jgi:hypothetical protein
VSLERESSSVIFGHHLTNVNPCHVLFWGCLKDSYNSKPGTEELKENDIRELEAFLQNSLKS